MLKGGACVPGTRMPPSYNDPLHCRRPFVAAYCGCAERSRAALMPASAAASGPLSLVYLHNIRKEEACL